MSNDFAPVSAMDFRPIPIPTIKQQMGSIMELQKEILQEDIDYGLIPGCGKKPTLLKPGAEKLLLMFRYRSQTRMKATELGGGHREYYAETDIIAPTGEIVATGIGICSTMESKYRYRAGASKSDTGIPVPKQYWNAKNQDAPISTLNGILEGALKANGIEIADMKVGRTKTDDGHMITLTAKGDKGENPDIADVYNTVAKMAKKRSLVDGSLNATGASGIFTQDIEDQREFEGWDAVDVTPMAPQQKAPPAPKVEPKAPPARKLGVDETKAIKRLSAALKAMGLATEEERLQAVTDLTGIAITTKDELMAMTADDLNHAAAMAEEIMEDRRKKFEAEALDEDFRRTALPMKPANEIYTESYMENAGDR